MRTKKFVVPRLEIDLEEIEPVVNNESIILTDEILKEYQLQIDKTKIEHFEDINFVSIFEE